LKYRPTIDNRGWEKPHQNPLRETMRKKKFIFNTSKRGTGGLKVKENMLDETLILRISLGADSTQLGQSWRRQHSAGSVLALSALSWVSLCPSLIYVNCCHAERNGRFFGSFSVSHASKKILRFSVHKQYKLYFDICI
jgi:hypothetical protein